MSRQVLLVDPDLDALGALASELRARGLNVALADNVEGAIERARRARPDAILFSDTALAGDFKGRVLRDRELSKTPYFVLGSSTEASRATAPDVECLPREPDLIARRIYALQVKGQTVVADRGDFRGDLQQVSVVDLLQLLSMNRRTGVLSINTTLGAGEVRLTEGEIVDAVFRRLEAEKALYRLLGEQDGNFAFASGSPSPLRRVTTPTSALLMEGMRQIDEVKRRRDALAADADALLAIAMADDTTPEVQRRIGEVLTAPHTIQELLDDVAASDLEILEALDEMLDQGVVRRIPRGAARVELGDASELTVLAAIAKRVQSRGFEGATRIAVLASPRTLSAVMHSVRRVADAIAPAESVPAAPVPHILATLRVADGVELDVLGVPVLEAYSPLWGLSLPGCVVAIKLESDLPELVDVACAVAGVPIVDAQALLGDVDVADPSQAAALIRAALETRSGA